MDGETKGALENVLKELDASKDEIALVNYAHTHVTKETNHALVISLFILSKQIKISTEKFIESNKELAKASDKNSRKMVALTWALVAVGVLQAISALISVFK